MAWLIWKQSRYAMPAAIVILVTHGVVMLILLIGYGDVVAKDSLVAMTIRITAWAMIVALLVFGGRIRKPATGQNFIQAK